jgi:hypothetical protein
MLSPATHDLGRAGLSGWSRYRPWMGLGPLVDRLGRLRCRELMVVVAKRWRRDIGQKESWGNVRLEKEIKINQDFLWDEKNLVRKRLLIRRNKHVACYLQKKLGLTITKWSKRLHVATWWSRIHNVHVCDQGAYSRQLHILTSSQIRMHISFDQSQIL